MSGLRYKTGRDMPPGMQEKVADKLIEQLRGNLQPEIVDMAKPVKFTILSAPYAISFECPYCHMRIEVEWKKADPPAYWGDPWPDAECPHCKKEIPLGDWEYD